MFSGIFFELDVLNVLVLGAILVLPLARVPLLKSYKRGATTLLMICVCHFAHLRPDLYRKRQLHRNHNFGTATSENGLSLNRPK